MLRMLRLHRIRARLSILAVTALLWSQMLLAFHADCASTAMPGSEAELAALHSDCMPSGNATDLTVCQWHCSQGDASSDTSRMVSVPALGAVLPIPVITVLRLVGPHAPTASPQLNVTLHRPTPNPASILLI